MITFTLFSALAAFYFTMFFTPGPNNAMLTASGMKFGFVRTLPHLIGIPLGHILQIGLTCFGLANLFLLYPQVQFYMKILCFIYLVYLGWKMIGSFSMVQKETGRPLRFFPTEENIFIGIAFVTITAAIICFPTISLWALFGSGLRIFINDIKIKKIIEYLLAVLLVLTGLFILLK